MYSHLLKSSKTLLKACATGVKALAQPAKSNFFQSATLRDSSMCLVVRGFSSGAGAGKKTQYVEEGEEYVEPKRGVIENTLINASVIIERTPVCFPDPEPWMEQLSEFKHHQQLREANPLPKDVVAGLRSKFRDDERVETFVPNPRITEDDLKNDRKSLYRALPEPLYLIVKVRQTEDKTLPREIWRFPTAEWREGETIRSAAERTIFYHAGEALQYYMLGNAPICHHVYTPSAELKKEFPNATQVKNFYMHALYLAGKFDLEEDSDVLDYAWVRKSELKEYFTTPLTAPMIELAERSLYY